MVEKKATATKKAAPKKVAAKKNASKAPELVTVQDMHALLEVLRESLYSRDKVVDHLQQQIEQSQLQVTQNQKIIAKRGIIYKLSFALLAIGVISATYSQHSVIKSFDDDMSNVSNNMDIMRSDMSAMKDAMESMSVDIHSMSSDFSQVSKDVSSIDKSVLSMSTGVRGMSHDTREMNRTMGTMTPPWTPFR